MRQIFFCSTPLLPLLLACSLILSSCSPGYVLRSAYYEAHILWKRVPIEKILHNPGDYPDISPEERVKLALVLAAGEFSSSIGFPPEGSYESFSDINRSPLLWVLMGSKKTAFEPATWWFPIVGSVPYKGFFNKEDAERAEAVLLKNSYETRLRGSDAFSTLGWFEDPILRGTLERKHLSLINTVLHEIFHQHVWISGHVRFNESAANFYAGHASIAFARWAEKTEHRKRICGRLQEPGEQESCKEILAGLFAEAQQAFVNEHAFARLVSGLYKELNKLYKQKLPEDEVLARRQEVFASHLREEASLPGKRKILLEVNNAEIMQLSTYLSGFPVFEKLFDTCGFVGTVIGEKIDEGDFFCVKRAFEHFQESDEEEPFGYFRRKYTKRTR